MKLTLKIWRQKNRSTAGKFEAYQLDNVSENMSFLEMLDVLNEKLFQDGIEPVAFEHDCREGICGCCSLMISGQAHGPHRPGTVCQLYMRQFDDGETVTIEPWRAAAFPVIKDLIVDRSALDRVIQAGGYVSVHTGQAPEASATLVPKQDAELAMDAASCIGCGACVAACPNASASLFISAKVSHLGLLPQGQPERAMRVQKMIEQADKEGLGYCTNHGECEAACPKGISLDFIARLNRDYLRSLV